MSLQRPDDGISKDLWNVGKLYETTWGSNPEDRQSSSLLFLSFNFYAASLFVLISVVCFLWVTFLKGMVVELQTLKMLNVARVEQHFEACTVRWWAGLPVWMNAACQCLFFSAAVRIHLRAALHKAAVRFCTAPSEPQPPMCHMDWCVVNLIVSNGQNWTVLK
jgi:hypothetical protein